MIEVRPISKEYSLVTSGRSRLTNTFIVSVDSTEVRDVQSDSLIGVANGFDVLESTSDDSDKVAFVLRETPEWSRGFGWVYVGRQERQSFGQGRFWREKVDDYLSTTRVVFSNMPANLDIPFAYGKSLSSLNALFVSGGPASAVPRTAIRDRSIQATGKEREYVMKYKGSYDTSWHFREIEFEQLKGYRQAMGYVPRSAVVQGIGDLAVDMERARILRAHSFWSGDLVGHILAGEISKAMIPEMVLAALGVADHSRSRFTARHRETTLVYGATQLLFRDDGLVEWQADAVHER